MQTTIAINGACGRMGLRIVHVAHADEDVQIGAAIDDAAHPHQGKDIGEHAGLGNLNLAVSSGLPETGKIDAVIDFSLPAGTMKILDACEQRKIPLVVATTGHTEEEKKKIKAAGHQTAILMAPNMSLAVNVLMKLLGEAAAAFKGKDFDVEILERHHRFKKDSPSGTALHLAHIVQDKMGQPELRHGREGLVGERPNGEIGLHAIRVGDNVGEHTIVFSTLGETLELTHRAHSRDCYARGAVQAAKFLAGRPPGWYSMADVLF